MPIESLNNTYRIIPLSKDSEAGQEQKKKQKKKGKKAEQDEKEEKKVKEGKVDIRV